MIKFRILAVSIIALGLYSATAENKDTKKEGLREAKILPVFQIVRFPNDVCGSTTRNGTCYTGEECTAKGGSNGGSCASGFGVCCIFELSCGSSSSENVTYLVQSSTTSSNQCQYKICPCSTNICRIRYDFTSFVIADQTTGTAAATGGQLNLDAVGDCTTDSFSISSPGKVGSPVICGTNTGYHMILDVANSNACQIANFDINAAATSTTQRSWDIKVTQYSCGHDDTAGPPGCLQYFTGTFGRIANYAFPTSLAVSSNVGDTVTHLQNQNYEYCFRRESGFCYICYSRTHGIANTEGATTAQHSFGLSLPAKAPTAATSAIGTLCSTDYITIPGGTTATNAAVTTTSTRGVTRFCGRYLANANEIDGMDPDASITAAAMTVCSRSTPFRIGFVSDSSEAGIAGTTEITNEQDGFPGGIIGFRLDWWQNAC